jgi:hypothetical protein
MYISGSLQYGSISLYPRINRLFSQYFICRWVTKKTILFLVSLRSNSQMVYYSILLYLIQLIDKFIACYLFD